MIIEILRLLVVYAGSCGLVLFLLNRHLIPISRRARAALVLLPMILTGRALVTGSFYGPLNMAYLTPPLQADASAVGGDELRDGILSDVAIQMVPWRKAVRESIKHGQIPLWNRFMLSGDVLLGAAQPAALSPTTLIGCLLPLATAWTFGSAFTFFLAAAFAFLLLRELGCSEVAALFGGAAWMLSGFLVFFIGWPQAAVFAVLPLMFFGVHRLRTSSRGGFGATLAACLLLALGGHPESMLHVVAASGLFLLFELLRCRGNPAGPLLRGVAAGVLAFGLAAPALLPFLQVEKESRDHFYRATVFAHQKKSHSPRDAMVLSSAAVYPNAYGPVWSSAGAPPDFLDASNAFAGGGALALALLGMFSRRREKWAIAVVGAASFAVAVGWPGVTDAISRLPLFDMSINVRLAGVAAFCIAVLAGLGLEELFARPARFHSAVLAAAGSALALGGLALRGRGLYPAPEREFVRSMILLGAPGAILAAAGAFRARGRLAVAGAALLAVAVHLAELAPLYPTIPARLFYPPIPELSALPRGDEPYRVTAAGYNLVPNQAALWELEDPRGYEGMTNSRYDTTYPLWCVRQPTWFNRVDDLTRPFLSFLNVRFAIGGPAEAVPRGWREVTRGNHCAIFENPAALPRAFVPKRVEFVSNASDSLERLGRMTEFASTAVVEDGGHAPSTLQNGEARLSVLRRGNGLELDIDAKEPAWVVVSNTSWSGWRASDDGKRLPLSYANVAFLAFRVGGGRHHVSLRYWPAGFSAGLALAGASSAILLLLLARRNRSSAGRN